MSSEEEQFLQELRATFKVEAEEHLQTIATGLMALEKTPTREAQRAIIENVFRAAHSLKSAARAVDFISIESMCQSLEDNFASWRREEGAPSLNVLDALHRTLNTITTTMITHQMMDESEHSASSLFRIEPVSAIPVQPPLAPAETVPSTPLRAVEKITPEETVRIPLAKLDARLLEAEEMIAAKLTNRQRVADLRELAERLEAWNKERATIEPEARAMRRQLDLSVPGHGERHSESGQTRLLEFFESSLDYIKLLENRVVTMIGAAERDQNHIGKLVDDLLENSKKLLLLPFGTITGSFPKMVRDLCREQGKEADLVISGEDVEMDKRILEEMKDPLIHLLRNCVDHGIETPDKRIHFGKPPRATVTIAVSRVNGSKVELRVSDDGIGIDANKVREAAIKQGLISANDARKVGDTEARALVFQSEISTSPIITRLSGRGLGLAIVREKAEKLGGTVSVDSESRRGTSISTVLPTMLATFRGILIEVLDRQFIVPTGNVACVTRRKLEDIQPVEGRETIVLNGRTVALVRMAEVLELSRAAQNIEPAGVFQVIVLGAGDQCVAFVVDAVLDEQEVLVKPLGNLLARVRNLAGATGTVTRVSVAKKATQTNSKAILVVEDSITSRMLLKSILGAAGYKVKTAVDGAEAFTFLRTENFDLVVSDVEMPRLNGFDLTRKIRADKKLAELPVVLVTALDTREDRERGIDVGANAYLVKSSFDQSNLLEVIRRLV